MAKIKKINLSDASQCTDSLTLSSDLDASVVDALKIIETPPEPPYYMIVRVDQRRKRKKGT